MFLHKLFTVGQPHHSGFSLPNIITLWQYSDGDAPNGGVEWRWVGKSRFLLSDRWLMQSHQHYGDGRPCSLRHRPPLSSESCLSQPAWTTTTKRTAQNLLVRSRKSDDQITAT